MLGAFAGDADAGCRYVKFASFDVETDFTSPHVKGAVNGVPAKVLLDTGAAVTALTREIAERADLPVLHSEANYVGVGGYSQGYEASIREFTLGPARWTRARMYVIWDISPGQDVILGANYLFQNDVELRLNEGLISLFKPDGCNKDSFLAYWDPDAVVVPFLNKSDDRVWTKVEINGQALRAIIDTGAEVSFIDTSAATKLGATKPTDPNAYGTMVGAGKKVQRTWVTKFDTFAIGAEVIRNANLTVGNISMNDGTDVILGADFLRAHRVLIAPSQRQVYLTHLGGKTFLSEPKAPTPAPSAPPAAASAP